MLKLLSASGAGLGITHSDHPAVIEMNGERRRPRGCNDGTSAGERWVMAGPADAHDRDVRAAERFEELFRRHHRAVAAYARRRAQGDTSDDVVASTFLVAWRRLGEVPADSLPWLLAVARNVIATQQRGSRRRGALRQRLERADGSASPSAAEESAGRVAAALGRLPETDREAITLIAWEGLRPGEAATVLGQSPAAFRVRLHRAKRRLRRELDRGQADPHPQHPSVAKEIAP